MPEIGKGKKLKNSQDFIVAVGAVFIVLLLRVPVPAVLLDFLMACNLLFALMMLLIVLYTPKATDFSSFPTLYILFLFVDT